MIPAHREPQLLSELEVNLIYRQFSGTGDAQQVGIESTPEKEPYHSASGHQRPRVQREDKNRLRSDFHMDLAARLRPHPFYDHAGEVAVLASDGHSLPSPTPEQFSIGIERYVIPIHKDEHTGGETVQSLSGSEAKEVLASPLFREGLRKVEHFNSVRLPVFGSGKDVELLPIGYDPRHQVLTSPQSPVYTETLTMDEVTRFFDDLLAGFSLEDNGTGKAAILAAMLTPYTVELFPAGTIVPTFLYEGKQPGVGKGSGVQLAVIPIQGTTAASAKPKDNEEMRKTLEAYARERKPFLFLDNVTSLKSSSLELFITAPSVAGRVLGRTETFTRPRTTIVFITANNPILSPDMERRIIRIRLLGRSASESKPATYYLDEPRIKELRPEILGSMYALVREWAAVGCPKASRTNPNFIRWSEIIGGILEHAGYALPY